MNCYKLRKWFIKIAFNVGAFCFSLCVCVCVCTSVYILNLATESKLYAIVMLMDMKGYNRELIHKYRVYISGIEDTLSWQCIHNSAWQEEGDLLIFVTKFGYEFVLKYLIFSSGYY